MQYISVVFQADNGMWRSTGYTFKTLIEGLKEGDLVIVETARGLQVTKVKKLNQIQNPSINYKFAFQKVNISDLEYCKEYELGEKRFKGEVK